MSRTINYNRIFLYSKGARLSARLPSRKACVNLLSHFVSSVVLFERQSNLDKRKNS